MADEVLEEAIAEEYKFLSSPTIRVNGRDIGDSFSETDCQCCGECLSDDKNKFK